MLQILNNFLRNAIFAMDESTLACSKGAMQTTRVLNETRVDFNEGHRLDGKPSYHSIRRWADQGIESKATGHVVTLEWAQYGGRRCTSIEAYARFNARLNGEKADAVSG